MQSLFLLAGIGLIVWFWLQSLHARELAIRTAKDLCQRQGLQLLDATVSLNSLRPRRNAQGHMSLLRTYQFEYSTDGTERQMGFVLLLGLRVESAGLAAEM